MEAKKAWARFNSSTGDILEITFNRNDKPSETDEWIECPEKIAYDFLSGKLSLAEYVVNKDEGVLTGAIHKANAINTRSFWDLCDAESKESPVIISEKTDTGFLVESKDDAKDITVYVTMKNDPNYLFKVLRLTEKNKKDINHWHVPINYDKSYSIYVRYYVTRN